MTAFILLSLTAPRPALTFPKPHYPLLCTITLASLVKGEVLSPEKIRATTGGIASSPPPRLTTPLPKPHYPLLCTITLASLVKGRWIDGKAQALILLLSACDMPNIFMLQTFLPSRRRDCLISTASPYNTLFQNRTIPCFALSHLPPLSKVRCCRPKKFGRLPEGLPHLHRLALQHPLPKPHHPSPRPAPSHSPSLVKGRWIDGKAQALILLLSACDMPTIFMLQIFCRQDGGIASSPPPRLTTPLPKPHHPLLYTITLAFK